MSNIDYTNPTDLLGQHIAVGDFVCWATTWGRSPHMEIRHVHSIRFTEEVNGRREVCEPQYATKYTLGLQALEPGRRWDSSLSTHVPCEPKPNTVQLVKNVVKITDSETLADLESKYRALLEAVSA